MRIIPIAPIPNQSLSVRLDGQRLVLRLKETGGVMAADLDRDGGRVLSGVRVLAGEPFIPYRYLASGNFLLLTLDGDLPDWREFGVSQSLVYLSREEIETAIAGTIGPSSPFTYFPAPIPLWVVTYEGQRVTYEGEVVTYRGLTDG